MHWLTTWALGDTGGTLGGTLASTQNINPAVHQSHAAKQLSPTAAAAAAAAAAAPSPAAKPPLPLRIVSQRLCQLRLPKVWPQSFAEEQLCAAGRRDEGGKGGVTERRGTDW